MNATKYYVKPHKKKSRLVLPKDIKRVLHDAKTLHSLCSMPVGIHSGGLAVAHSQITKNDPLNFFVIQNGEIIINPKIVRHTKHTIDSEEGCLSFPDLTRKTVQRWNKCEVQYQKIEGNRLSELISENLTGIRAKIFQHEIDHAECKYIY
jgi:peptide deformylase